MRLNITDSELKEQLKAEIAHFKELDRQKEEMAQGDLTVQNLSEHIKEWEQLKVAWQDSAEQIAYLYKKLHPYFPVGTCPHCGSVTSKIIGSGRNHYGCVACGEETVS